MLEFLRKYQSYIFIVVTVVIIISFSFFGTYNTIVSNPTRDQVVFTAIDGENVRRSDLDEMVLFINTDSHDKQMFGGSWGPNFLNNGVIRKDLLETGMAEILANAYLSDLEQDLEPRLQKEKAFKLYTHPQVKFISQEFIWNLYAPTLLENYKALQKVANAKDEKGFETRVKLFKDEMAFPSYYMHSLLSSQEKQYKNVFHDEALDRTDFSLFGYHTVEDWFGPRFIKLSAQFIINAAKLAEEKGYVVTKEETLADLFRNSLSSYNQNSNNPRLGVLNSTEYFNEQLRILGLDQNQAVKVWRQVLLFRRLFNDIGSSVFVDPKLYENLSQFAGESLTADSYTLPKELQFADYKDLQKFDTYLSYISKRAENDPLTLPKEFLTAKEVARRSPELVQKRYLIKLKEVNKKSLTSKVSLKEMWNFELEHFDLLKEKFPFIAIKKADTKDERVQILDQLDDVTRARIDQFVKNEIVDSHPEWLNKALENAREKTLTVGISQKGGHIHFEGLENGSELINALDKHDFKTGPLKFTADREHYYLITVLDKAETEEILTFKEAKQVGVLDELLEKKLKNYYQKNKEDKNWGSFEEAKEVVTNDYFDPLLKAIAVKSEASDKTSGQLLAPFYFVNYLKEAKIKLQENPNDLQNVAIVENETSDAKIIPAKPLDAQWKLQKLDVTLTKSKDVNKKHLFDVSLNSWTDIEKATNGDLSFYFIKGKEAFQDTKALADHVASVQKMVGNEARQNYMKKVVGEIQKDNAISLEYLNQPIETVEFEESAPVEVM